MRRRPGARSVPVDLFLLLGSSSCRVRHTRAEMHVERVSIRPWVRPFRWLDSAAVRTAWQALWTSRLVVLAAGVLAVLSFGDALGSRGFDPGRLTAPFGYSGNL